MKCNNCGVSVPVRKSLSTTKSEPLRKTCPDCGEPIGDGRHQGLLFK